MNADIDFGVAMAALAAAPTEHCYITSGFLDLNNIGHMLACLWEHGVHEPVIVMNPYRMLEMIDHTWYETADTEVKTWPQLINRMLLRRLRPIKLVPNSLWHKMGTFRGYIYGSPFHAVEMMDRNSVVAYDPRARWFSRIRSNDAGLTSEIIFAGASAKIAIM